MPTTSKLPDPGDVGNSKGVPEFLQGIGKSYEAGLPADRRSEEFRQTLFGAYIQDDWPIAFQPELNLGLRYEMTTVLKDGLGKITNLANISDPAPVCATQF